MSVSSSPPFDRLRARTLLPECLLGGIVAGVIGALVGKLVGTGANQWVLFALFYVGGGAVLGVRMKLAGVDFGKVFGRIPSAEMLRLAVVAVPLMALTVAGFWLLFLPLSYVAPGFVRSWGLATADMQPVVTFPAWSMQFLVAVIMAPIVEELLFRGVLLQRWATKWGTRTAVIATSALFAIGHVELLGHFAFGLVMCALYLRTRSLWVSIGTHALNNGIVSIGTLASVLHPTGVDEPMTLQSLRSDWWMGPVLLVVGLALLEWYRRRYWADVDIRALLRGEVPYFR